MCRRDRDPEQGPRHRVILRHSAAIEPCAARGVCGLRIGCWQALTGAGDPLDYGLSSTLLSSTLLSSTLLPPTSRDDVELDLRDARLGALHQQWFHQFVGHTLVGP